MSKEDGGPAFPRPPVKIQRDGKTYYEYVDGQRGMSLRAYAAIHLKVPDSGLDWLDAMIRASKRDELSGRAMQAMVGNEFYVDEFSSGEEVGSSKKDYSASVSVKGAHSRDLEEIASGASSIADAMLAEGGGE